MRQAVACTSDDPFKNWHMLIGFNALITIKISGFRLRSSCWQSKYDFNTELLINLKRIFFDSWKSHNKVHTKYPILLVRSVHIRFISLLMRDHFIDKKAMRDGNRSCSTEVKITTNSNRKFSRTVTSHEILISGNLNVFLHFVQADTNAPYHLPFRCNPLVTDGFPSQKASYAESVSIMYSIRHAYPTHRQQAPHGPLTRYAKLRIAHAPGMPGIE